MLENIIAPQFTNDLIRLFALSAISFGLAMALTPIYTYFAYRYKFWKRQRTTSTTGEALKVFTKLHEEKFQRNIPTMAGIITVLAVTLVTLVANFDRQQTWLPLAAFLGGGLIGVIDDIINIRGIGGGTGGLRTWLKFSMLVGVAAIGAWFFYSKLGYTSVHVPYWGQWELGWLIIPPFIAVVVSTGNAVNISDGLDGLAGGLLASSFTTFGAIALLQGNLGLAIFCFTICGALLSYIWFNIYPARFFMGDVGSFALGTALGVVAMLTDTIFLLPLIGGLFVIEAGSSLIQIISKRLFKKKIFLSAPVHHHFEAIGWPETKVTMRFWVIANVLAVVGLLVAVSGGSIS